MMKKKEGLYPWLNSRIGYIYLLDGIIRKTHHKNKIVSNIKHQTIYWNIFEEYFSFGGINNDIKKKIRIIK